MYPEVGETSSRRSRGPSGKLEQKSPLFLLQTPDQPPQPVDLWRGAGEPTVLRRGEGEGGGGIAIVANGHTLQARQVYTYHSVFSPVINIDGRHARKQERELIRSKDL